ncbi:Uncharacterized protein HZ326_11324 [Fusarium oxysporum f. sp. albedinis]|nr:Uncharacterized protein HZ326_11324 [Fusarium oxysporum f. sp. albedinis]
MRRAASEDQRVGLNWKLQNLVTFRQICLITLGLLCISVSLWILRFSAECTLSIQQVFKTVPFQLELMSFQLGAISILQIDAAKIIGQGNLRGMAAPLPARRVTEYHTEVA